ncbi:MAG TPA: hypothetical protein VNL77_01605 [Roseiflexaceae bacterium]|nr:hypothetical protein [Roseiflexaceae bacterium]
MDPQTRQPQSYPAEQEEKNLAERVSDKVAQAADDLQSKSPGEIVDDARMKTGQAIDAARQKTAEATAAASDKAADVMTAAGDRMNTLAQTVREKAPAEGPAREIASTAADALERSGRYLQEADPSTVRYDLERIIREHPIEAMLVGLGIGYLLARSIRR